MKPREWREETLSARNRLFKLLTSPTLDRVMGLAGHSINLSEIIEEGSFLLVNLAPSDYLSHENAAVFGALLVNEFFECAMRRDTKHGDPQPYYLYLDEFQNFVSPAIAGMLDQIRKFGIFLTLAHQRFGQLDEDITDAVLTNCKIKAVFGGLRAESARMMAEELFIGKLDPDESQSRHLPDQVLAQVRPRQGLHPRHEHTEPAAARAQQPEAGETTSASVSCRRQPGVFLRRLVFYAAAVRHPHGNHQHAATPR